MQNASCHRQLTSPLVGRNVATVDITDTVDRGIGFLDYYAIFYELLEFSAGK